MEDYTQEQCDCEKKDKKMKNLVSISILLFGLFVGSIFVDVAQLVQGSGFSQKNLSETDIFEAYGKTWVAYNEPAVPVMVITDENCEKCDVTEAVVWLRRVLPTVSVNKVSFDSEEGKNVIEKSEVKTLPAFIFSEQVTKTDFYTQAAMLFAQKDKDYVLNTQELGLPAGRYLNTPEVKEENATFGNKDANLKVIVFSDYQCPYCNAFYKSFRGVMKEYQDKALFVYKHLPLEIHPQAEPAALSAECAKEQGKFWEYSDKLYQSQNEWGATKNTAKFKEYARALGLNTTDFNKCLDDKKYLDQITVEKNEATEFGIGGTPAIFVGDQFESGAIEAAQLKEMIEGQLNK